uniref:ATVPS33 (Arabidopsis thaliana vacuolar protein sorting 33); protein transporter n=1 Tax=Solanum tuberosum TaxID=4113 RepID=M1C5Q0_SOLTU
MKLFILMIDDFGSFRPSPPFSSLLNIQRYSEVSVAPSVWLQMLENCKCKSSFCWQENPLHA